jgi:hypothetical protein
MKQQSGGFFYWSTRKAQSLPVFEP